MIGEDHEARQRISGQVKWFDPIKGFGFIADSEGGTDVLVHANVLRNFGQSSVVDGARVEVLAIRTPRGRQAVEVLSVLPAHSESVAPIADLEPLEGADLGALPLLPARVKWFDRVKGFGFANIFGRKGDVFLHVEVLRRWGFADLQSGEAVGLRIVTAPRGLMAAQIVAWERAVVDGPEDDGTETAAIGPASDPAGGPVNSTGGPSDQGTAPEGASSPVERGVNGSGLNGNARRATLVLGSGHKTGLDQPATPDHDATMIAHQDGPGARAMSRKANC